MMNGPRNEQLIPYHDSWLLVEPSSDTIYKYSPDHNQTPFIVRTPSIQTLEFEVFMTDRYYFMQTVKKEYDFGSGRGFLKTNLAYDKQQNAIFEYIVYNDDFADKPPVDLVYSVTVIMHLYIN